MPTRKATRKTDVADKAKEAQAKKPRTKSLHVTRAATEAYYKVAQYRSRFVYAAIKEKFERDGGQIKFEEDDSPRIVVPFYWNDEASARILKRVSAPKQGWYVSAAIMEKAARTDMQAYNRAQQPLTACDYVGKRLYQFAGKQFLGVHPITKCDSKSFYIKGPFKDLEFRLPLKKDKLSPYLARNVSVYYMLETEELKKKYKQ